ncbi:MAG: NAD(P)H-dependent oxidoreductase subunit E [Candidatus Hydrogenedentota bacterium]
MSIVERAREGKASLTDPADAVRAMQEGPTAAQVSAAAKKLEPRIADLLTRYLEPRAALLPVLHLYQHEFGWIPLRVQREIAFRLSIAPADVSRVVSFYTLFHSKPCGRHVVMVCGTLSCELAGCNKVLRALKDVLGVDPHETTPDGLFTVQRVECLGWCDKAPVVQVNDGDFMEHVTPEKIKAEVKRIRG